MQTVYETLARRRFPSRTALTCGDHGFKYETMFERSAQIGSVFASIGAIPGDRIAVLAANCCRYVEAFLGIPGREVVQARFGYLRQVPRLTADRDAPARPDPPHDQ